MMKSVGRGRRLRDHPRERAGHQAQAALEPTGTSPCRTPTRRSWRRPSRWTRSPRLLFKGIESNPYNIAPTISPDGKSIIFLSTRDLFSIDLYLADAETGNDPEEDRLDRRRPPFREHPVHQVGRDPGTRRARSSSSAASPRAGPG
ncbi:MAG: hypothetical protein M0C28_32235 [Candidatus Moduliflexus flocculans]|nr:hypothetical protein [Candidatus Moduliflexus flocculans]